MHATPDSTTVPPPTVIADLAALGKLRLASLVVISAGIAYLIGALSSGAAVNWLTLTAVVAGGLLITLSANALNEVIERHEDALMARTAERPLPAGRLTVLQATAFAMGCGVAGIALLGSLTNAWAAGLASVALLSYAFVYTPAKRWGPVAVFIGTVPGALPSLIGWVAATNHIGAEGLFLFGMQVLWQLPHFWAVAWRLRADYARGGFQLMPYPAGAPMARLIVISVLALLPLVSWAWAAGLLSVWAAAGLVLCVAAFAWPALQLVRSLSDADALRVMFASFIVLPVMQLIVLLDRLF
jgi:heme o synthase